MGRRAEVMLLVFLLEMLVMFGILIALVAVIQHLCGSDRAWFFGAGAMTMLCLVMLVSIIHEKIEEALSDEE